MAEEDLGNPTKLGFSSLRPTFLRALGLTQGTWKQPGALQKGEDSSPGEAPPILKLVSPASFSLAPGHLAEPEEKGNRAL